MRGQNHVHRRGSDTRTSCGGGGGYNYQDIDVRLVHSALEYLRYEVLLYLQTFSIGTVVVGA